MLHELHTSVFAPVLQAAGWPLSCDECDGDLGCAEPMGLTNVGEITKNPDNDPATIVRWPACPAKWFAMRRVGADVITMAQAASWGVDRNRHLDPMLGAGGARIYREFLRIRETPGHLLEARAYADAKSGRGA